MPPLIPTPQGATEILSARTLKSKTFDLGNGQRRISTMLAPAHVPSSVQAWERGEVTTWLDPDTTIERVGDFFEVRNAWYRLRVPATGGFSYAVVSRRGAGGEYRVELDEIVGHTGPLNIAPVIEGNVLRFPNVVPDLDLRLVCLPDRVQFLKRLKSSSAPREFVWRVSNDAPNLRRGRLMGWDNAERANSRPKRGLLLTESEEDAGVIGGRTWKRVREKWNGDSLETDPVTRVKHTRKDTVFPVDIDPTIQETIGADLDDVSEDNNATLTQDNGFWLDHYYYGDRLQPFYGRWPGWRFQSVLVPQGATIDSATLTLRVSKVNSVDTDFTNSFIYADNVDDAAAWGASSRPSQITKTTAKVSVSGGTISTTGVKNFNVATIVQAIVNRSGWASGNDMRFAILGGTSERSAYFDDLNADQNAAAILDITYTAGGTGALSGTSAGVGSTSAALTGRGALAGVSNGVAGIAAVLSGLAMLSASSAGSASTTAAIQAILAAAGSAAGASTTTAVLAAVGRLLGESNGAGTVAGGLTGRGALSGSSAGLGAVTGTLEQDNPGLLDKFATDRNNGEGEDLFGAYLGEDPNQTRTIENGSLKIVVGSSSEIYMEFIPRGSSGYNTPDGYLKYYMQSGTWDTGNNRLSFLFKTDKTIARDSSGSDNLQIGTYVRPTSETDPNNAGDHYYHLYDVNFYAGRWMKFWMNRTPQHKVTEPGSLNWGEDPSFADLGIHYFDGMTRWYFDTQQASFANSTNYFDDIYVYRVAGEPDDEISSIAALYTGTRYEVTWAGLKNVARTYEIRYSTSSMKSAGFTSGTDGGTTTNPDSDYTGCIWQSSPMAESSTGMYIAIRVQGGSSFTQIFLPYQMQPGNSGEERETSGALSGSAAGTGTAAAALTGRGALSGASAGVASLAGILRGLGALTGSAAGLATVSGSVITDFINGLAQGLAVATGNLTGVGALSGASASQATTLGFITGHAALSGQVSSVSTAGGLLVGVGNLSGALAGAGNAEAVLRAFASMSGSSAGVGEATGAMWDGITPSYKISVVSFNSKPFGMVYFIR
jgi:hypothetical protein